MPMHKTQTLLYMAAILLPLALAAPTQAQIYPWCAVYSGGMGGGTNCGFSTLAQCRVTVSGIGGFCDPNPFYAGPAESRAVRKRKSG
jgi:hypothetical protein